MDNITELDVGKTYIHTLGNSRCQVLCKHVSLKDRNITWYCIRLANFRTLWVRAFELREDKSWKI